MATDLSLYCLSPQGATVDKGFHSRLGTQKSDATRLRGSKSSVLERCIASSETMERVKRGQLLSGMLGAHLQIAMAPLRKMQDRPPTRDSLAKSTVRSSLARSITTPFMRAASSDNPRPRSRAGEGSVAEGSVRGPVRGADSVCDDCDGCPLCRGVNRCASQFIAIGGDKGSYFRRNQQLAASREITQVAKLYTQQYDNIRSGTIPTVAFELQSEGERPNLIDNGRNMGKLLRSRGAESADGRSGRDSGSVKQKSAGAGNATADRRGSRPAVDASGTLKRTVASGHGASVMGTFVPGSRIMYGSWVALENSNGKFLCLHRRGPKFQGKYPSDAPQPPWGTDPSVNASWCTADLPHPLPNTTVRKCLFRIRNANWLADTGRVKQGDHIMFEVADDVCLGSNLQFKRASKEWNVVKAERDRDATVADVSKMGGRDDAASTEKLTVVVESVVGTDDAHSTATGGATQLTMTTASGGGDKAGDRGGILGKTGPLPPGSGDAGIANQSVWRPMAVPTSKRASEYVGMWIPKVHADGGHSDESQALPANDEDIDIDAAKGGIVSADAASLRSRRTISDDSSPWNNGFDPTPDVTHLAWISLHQDWGHLLVMPEDATVAVAPEPGRMKLREAKDSIKSIVNSSAGEQPATVQSLTAIRNVMESTGQLKGASAAVLSQAGIGSVPLFSSLSVAAAASAEEVDLTSSYVLAQAHSAAVGDPARDTVLNAARAATIAHSKSDKSVSLALAGQSSIVQNDFPRVGGRGMWRIHLAVAPSSSHGENEHAAGKENFTEVILSATGQLKMMESVAVARDVTRKEIRDAIQAANATCDGAIDEYSKRLQRALEKTTTRENTVLATSRRRASSRMSRLRHDRDLADSIRASEDFAEGFLSAGSLPYDLDESQRLSGVQRQYISSKAEADAIAAEVSVPSKFWEVMNQRKILLAMLLQQTTTVESAVRNVQRRFRKYMRLKWHRRIKAANADVDTRMKEEVILVQQRSGVADQLRSSFINASNSTFHPVKFLNTGGKSGEQTAIGISDPVLAVRRQTALRISEVTAAIQEQKRAALSASGCYDLVVRDSTEPEPSRATQSVHSGDDVNESLSVLSGELVSEGEEEGDAAAEEAAAKESEALVRAAHQTTESLDAAAMAELFSPTKRASLSGPAGFGSANGSPKCGRRIRRRSTAVSMIGQSEVEKALDSLRALTWEAHTTTDPDADVLTFKNLGKPPQAHKTPFLTQHNAESDTDSLSIGSGDGGHIPSNLASQLEPSRSSVDVYEATTRGGGSQVLSRAAASAAANSLRPSGSKVPNMFWAEQTNVELDLSSSVKLLALHNPKLFDDLGSQNSVFRHVITHDTEASERLEASRSSSLLIEADSKPQRAKSRIARVKSAGPLKPSPSDAAKRPPIVRPSTGNMSRQVRSSVPQSAGTGRHSNPVLRKV